jgi:hypothetical protein
MHRKTSPDADHVATGSRHWMLYRGLPNSEIDYLGWLLDLYEFWLNTLALFEIFVKS